MAKPTVIELPPQWRAATLQRMDMPPTADGEPVPAAERRYEIAFSSEDPYNRGWGIEVLGHREGEIDLKWLSGGRAPLLWQHNHDQPIGVIESARVDADGVGRAVVRFGVSKKACEVRDEVENGTLGNVSVGYMIRRMVLQDSDTKPETYRVVDWEPIEASIVSVPADMTVGVGRAANPGETYEALITDEKGQQLMSTDTEAKAVVATEQPDPAPAARAVDTDANRREQERLQLLRETAEISRIGAFYGRADQAADAIERGVTLAAFREQIMNEAMRSAGSPVKPQTFLDMSSRERERYSLMRAIRARANGDWSNAGIEREASNAIAQRIGREPNGFFVPVEGLMDVRELTAGTATDGAELVGTDHRDDMFIELLRPRMMLARLGARPMPGLQGNVDIPRQSAGAAVAWGAESADAAETEAQFNDVQLTPNQASTRTLISRRLMAQSSPSVEQLIRDDLRTALALGIDLAGIAGSGSSNQPRGILNTANIGVVYASASDGDGAAPIWDDVVALEGAVATANADMGALAYLTTPGVAQHFKSTLKASGVAGYIMGETRTEDGFNTLNAYRCGVTTQVPSDLTQNSGTGLSAVIFGNFNDLLIATWGVVDLIIDGISRNDGGTMLKIFQDVDIAVRHPESFAVIPDASV